MNKTSENREQKWRKLIARSIHTHTIPSKSLSCLRYVDLNSYRHSRYWLGCYRKKGDFSLSIMRKAISLFIKEFCQDFDSCYMISSMVHMDDFQVEESDEILDLANKAEKRLGKYGYIDKARDDEELDIHELTDFSLFKKVDKNTVRDLAATAMTNPWTFGHVFFIFESLNLVAYPHDETGFGFIGIDDCSMSYRVRDFLVKVEGTTFESLWP